MEKQDKWKIVRARIIDSSFTPRIRSVLHQLPVTVEPVQSLYIYSEDCNTGKTILACQKALGMLCNAYMNGPKIGEMVFISEIQLMTVYTSKGFSDSSHMLLSLMSVPLLIYDDFCSTRDSAFLGQIILTLISGRYENMLPTIYTSNVTPEKLASVVEGRIASRLWRSVDVCIEKQPWDK